MELGLSPEIEEAQSKIRSKVFKIENDIKDISEIIINFRKKLNKKADLIMEVPDLDKIYRSILYITQHTIKISNSLRTFDIEIRKYENDLVLNNKSLLFNSSKQTQKIEKSLEPILYNNLLKNENKNEIKDTSNEKKISQKIQFKSLLKIALTSGRNTFLNDNVKKVDSITIVRQDDTEDEESEDYSDGKENNLSQKHYDSSEYDTNEDFDEYLKESNENDGNDDEDNDIIDDEFDDEYDKPALNGFNWAAAGMKKPVDPEGTWECPSCMVKNKPDATQCIACETDKPGAKKSDDLKTVPTFGSNKLGISFGKPSSSKPTDSSTPSTSGFNWAAAGMKKPVDPEGTWECPSCMVKNKPDATQCIACETDKPGAKKSDDLKTVPTFGSNNLGISFGKPTPTEEIKSDETPKPFESNSIGFSFGNSSSTENKNEEKKKDFETSFGSTESTKSNIGFSFANSNYTEQKNDTNEKIDNINQEKDQNNKNNDEDLDIDTTTEKIGSLGGNSFGFNSSSKNETHNVFGISTTKSTTTSVFGQTSDNNSSSFNSFVSSNTTTSASPFNNSNTFTKNAASVFGNNNTFSNNNTTNSVFNNNSSTSNSFGNSVVTPSFGQSSFGQSSTFNKPAFGQTTAFGQSTSNSVFGQTSSIGNSVMNSGFSSFTNQNNQSTSEKPVFGSSTQIGFGNTSMLGMNSAFGTPSAFGSGSTFSSVMNTSNLGSGKGFSAFSKYLYKLYIKLIILFK